VLSSLPDLQKERGFPHPSRKKKLLKFKRESTPSAALDGLVVRETAELLLWKFRGEPGQDVHPFQEILDDIEGSHQISF